MNAFGVGRVAALVRRVGDVTANKAVAGSACDKIQCAHAYS